MLWLTHLASGPLRIERPLSVLCSYTDVGHWDVHRISNAKRIKLAVISVAEVHSDSTHLSLLSHFESAAILSELEKYYTVTANVFLPSHLK